MILLPYDLRDEAAPQEIVDKAVAKIRWVRYISIERKTANHAPSIAELPIEQVKDTFMVNIISMFALVKAAEPHLPAGERS